MLPDGKWKVDIADKPNAFVCQLVKSNYLIYHTWTNATQSEVALSYRIFSGSCLCGD